VKVEGSSEVEGGGEKKKMSSQSCSQKTDPEEDKEDKEDKEDCCRSEGDFAFLEWNTQGQWW